MYGMNNESSFTLQQAFEEAVQVLGNANAGWVNRRDAAEVLGFIAQRAREALEALRNDADPDVRAAVEKAITACPMPDSSSASGTPAGYSLRELAQACAKDNIRIVTAQHDSCYLVTVHLKNGRRQTVYLSATTTPDGRPVLRLFTPCGPARENLFAWALRSNAQIATCALEVEEKEGSEPQFILRMGYPMGEATPALIKTAVKELAMYGDWLEDKLTGGKDKT